MDSETHNLFDSSLAGLVENDLTRFLGSLPLGVLALDRRGRVLAMNAFARNLLPLRPAAPDTPWQDAAVFPVSVSLREFINGALASPDPKGPVVVAAHGDTAHGECLIELRTSAIPLSSDAGEAAVVFFVREAGDSEQNVASRVLLKKHPREERVEDELRRERSMFRQLMDTVPDKIFFKDLRGRFIRIGRTHALQFGLKDPEEAVGKTDFDFFAEAYAQETRDEEEEVIRTGQPMVGKEHKLALSDGTLFWVSATKVPLRDPDGRIVGTIGISRDVTERKLAEEKLRVRNEEMQADLKMAYEVQQSLLTLQYPDFLSENLPGATGLRFNHRYLPVSTLAGDFFEIFRVSETEAGVLICDVVGHGVRAALITAFIRGLVGEIMPLARDPGAFLGGLNRGLLPVLRQADSPMFVTAFYALADTTTGEFSYGNAGHPLPFLQRSGGGVVRATPPAADPEPALGLIDNFAYTAARDKLAAGDRAVLFTDGLFEVESPDGEPFGEDRIKRELAASPDVETAELLDRLTAAARKHAGSEEFDDDVCLVAVESVCVREKR